MILLVIALLADAPTLAEPATQPVTPVVQVGKPKLVCRSYAVTGSLVTRQRVCRTAKAWGKVEDDAQREAERLTPHVATERGG